ncbi:MAG TPA: cysteine synthase family protein [bacterium]|nr:cysteine synthase family protein [bacterium]
MSQAALSGPRIYESVTELVGRTPLVEVRSHGVPGVKLYAKLESFNPGGSVKDRPALRMIEQGIRSGKLTKDKVILDATSGNTGIAYAMIGAALGFKVLLAMPANVSDERKRILKSFNAEVRYSSPMEGSDGAIRLAREMLKEAPDKYYVPDQYNNPENPMAHYLTTAEEILEAVGGEITHFAAGIGTSGTLMGTGKRLKEVKPSVQVVALEPAEPFHGLEGLKHMASSIVPGIYDTHGYDFKITMDTEESYEWVQRLARREGLLVGLSSGGAMDGCIKLAKRIQKGCIVTVFPDSGDKYLSTRVWE